MFDQSIGEGNLKTPLPIASGLKNAGLIEGWKEGMKGMKIGGVRELTIPSDKAYGEQGSDSIAPNMPLKFLVMAIPIPAEIPASDALSAAMSEYLKAQTAVYGGSN